MAPEALLTAREQVLDGCDGVGGGADGAGQAQGRGSKLPKSCCFCSESAANFPASRPIYRLLIRLSCIEIAAIFGDDRPAPGPARRTRFQRRLSGRFKPSCRNVTALRHPEERPSGPRLEGRTAVLPRRARSGRAAKSPRT